MELKRFGNDTNYVEVDLEMSLKEERDYIKKVTPVMKRTGKGRKVEMIMESPACEAAFDPDFVLFRKKIQLIVEDSEPRPFDMNWFLGLKSKVLKKAIKEAIKEIRDYNELLADEDSEDEVADTEQKSFGY